MYTYIHTYIHIVAAIGNKAYLRYARVPKMTYLHGKSDLLIRQKRPSNIGLPEVCVSVKRALFAWQKRPIIHAKETYTHTGVCSSVKRDLLQGKRDLS